MVHVAVQSAINRAQKQSHRRAIGLFATYMEQTMEQLIANLAQQFGIDEALAQKAVGLVLSLLQNQGDGSAVSELFDKLPGASDLATQFADAGSGSESMLRHS